MKPVERLERCARNWRVRVDGGQIGRDARVRGLMQAAALTESRRRQPLTVEDWLRADDEDCC